MHLGARAGFPGGKKPETKKPGTALVIPKPINLPSRRKENNGFDPSISLVPASSSGSWMGSGTRSGVALPAGTAMGLAGMYPLQLAGRPNAVQATGLPRPSGSAVGWGSPSASTAMPGRGAAGGDFPELGGLVRPANPWKAPTSTPPVDDLKNRPGTSSASRRPLGEGRGNGRDWAEDDEEEAMDFKRPVVIERERGGASTTSSTSMVASTVASSTSMPATSLAASSVSPDTVSARVRPDPREEARILALKKQVELEKMQEQLFEQQRRQEREAAEQLQRQEQEEQDRRRKESEEQRLAHEEARRLAMEQAEERRSSEQKRRLYEDWQEEQRRRIEEQRRMQQQQQFAGHDQVRSQLSMQETSMRQASDAAKLRHQHEEERGRELERAARNKLDELDRKRGERLGPGALGGDALMHPGMGPPRSAWGNADSVSGAGGVVGISVGPQEAEYSSMARGRGANPKEPRKLYDHKTDKFVSEDQEAWKGLNRPAASEKGTVKGSDRSSSVGAGSIGKDSRTGQQVVAGLMSGKESEGMSRAALKKLALEERRRREREGRTNGEDDDDVMVSGDWKDSKAGDKNPPAKRLLTRDHDRGVKSSAGARHSAAGILGADAGSSMESVGRHWMTGMAGGLGNEEFDVLATSSSWSLSHGASWTGGGMGGKSMGASLGLHDGDMGGMFKMEDTNDVATGAADFILEGDDEPVSGIQNLNDDGCDDDLLDHSSFNTPAGWAPAASREAWGGEQTSGAGAWDTRALSQGTAVNIEKAFGAFNGVGNNSMLGGLTYSLAGAQSNLVWSGTMMSVGHDVASDWQLSNDEGSDTAQRMTLPQGWSAPPPDSFQPAGDEMSQGHPGRQGGDGAGGKGQRGRHRQQRDTTKAGGGRGSQHKNRGSPAEFAGTADFLSNKPAENSQGVDASGANRGGRAGRPQSANLQSRGKRNAAEKGARAHQPDGQTISAAGPGTMPKESSGEKTGAGTASGKNIRGKARGAGKVVPVPANIRIAAQDHIVKQRDAAATPPVPE